MGVLCPLRKFATEPPRTHCPADFTAGQVQALTKKNNYAAQQTKPVAKDANAGGLSHIDILSYMLGHPVVTAG